MIIHTVIYLCIYEKHAHHFLLAIKGSTVSLTSLKLLSSMTIAASSSGPSSVRMRMHFSTKCRNVITVLLFSATAAPAAAFSENSVMQS